MVQHARRRDRDLLPTVSWGAAPAAAYGGGGNGGGGGGGSSHGGGGGGGFGAAARKRSGADLAAAGSLAASQTASVLGFDFRTSLATEATGYVPPGPRQWLKYDAHGRVTVIPADKRPLIEDLALPFRDAVMVNPMVPTPYPPAIFIRDAALVLNLGSLRACVGSDRVFLLSVPDESSEHWAFPDPNGRFERELGARLAGTAAASAGNGGGGGDGVADPAAALATPAPSSGADLLAAGAALTSPPPPPGVLPYELRALEACLAEALSDLSSEAAYVAEKTLPALERLAEGGAVTRRGLEAVRGAKLAIKRLEARITGLKRELEEIINDDDDMRDMLLTHRRGLAAGLAAATAAAEAAESEETTEEEDGGPSAADAAAPASPPSSLASDRRSLSPASTLRRRTPGGGPGAALAGPLERLASAGWAPVPLEPGVLARGGGGGGGDGGPATNPPLVVRAASHHDVAACESMLESYFMQADFLLSRLYVLKERIDDTEDLVGIELDTRRNELVALQLLVTLATAALAVISTVGSLLGMNLAPLPIEASVIPFYAITGGSIAGGLALFGFTIWYARARRILWIPKVPRD